MKWDFVYEEESPGLYGNFMTGIISNGVRFLFFAVCRIDEAAPEYCQVYNSISLHPDTLECEYIWTAENDSILLDCLNELGNDNCCGEGSPIRTLEFK